MNCDTKYPILLIHGTGYRDRSYFNYWGRIPFALEKHGAKLFYGNQDAWGSIEYNAGILKNEIHRILDETKCEKVNIIAHSKGGLEARYLISSLGMADKVASLTTFATPHHGSKTMDLLYKIPKRPYKIAAVFMNLFFRTLGDGKPDFYRVIRYFTTGYMKRFNKRNPDAPQVYYQSYSAVMKNPLSDISMFWPNLVVWLVEGENDGLVTPTSATWTNFKGVLRGPALRGISHSDEVDAYRRIGFGRKVLIKKPSSMIRFYIKLVSALKQMGL